ncbi:sensor histidine kinase [Candidatus Enterovibrio altilux]|uniref:histidine kinase n=1 Tax=Candidatus Enterovibrio altilux TaxID=1927128 RepID=A0A291B8B1_9GAMM|nr:ATP-binding protein [Candidatus Enterovibrio luxaltus]ATF09207.1 Flagellar sensor histidine kinase FleS [Candidatus Enterovibrio luxaltus]
MEAKNSPFGTVDQQVLNVMPAGIILLDPYGRVAEANPEAHRLLGEPLEQIRWVDVIYRAFFPREDDGHEISLRDGRRVKLAISASDSGQIILLTDMTETRLLQSCFSDLQRLSSLGQMVASLAHQVRTPLSSALLYAANLAAPNINEHTRKHFQVKLIDRLHDLEKQVNNMLLFAKGGDNKVTNLFTIEHLLNEFEPMVEAAVNSQNVKFEINCDNESLLLLGNAHALASALSNLVINAIQVAENECKIVVDTRTTNGHMFLSVSDNGPGIQKELQNKIIEPFFTTRQQGTGLGLAIVQMVCHAHKGRMTLHSQPGQGACFTLCLPLAENSNVAYQKISGTA